MASSAAPGGSQALLPPLLIRPGGSGPLLAPSTWTMDLSPQHLKSNTSPQLYLLLYLDDDELCISH